MVTSLRHRELGATVRQCALTGMPAHVVIDHQTYKVSVELVEDRSVVIEGVLTIGQAARFASSEYERGVRDGQRIGWSKRMENDNG